MEWCKLYATFSTDPKVRSLSDRAFRRYVEAMCDTTMHETDGQYLFPPDKATVELVTAGLVDESFEGLKIHGWGQRQRTKADVDAKRIAGRNAARIRWGNAAPNTEVEVEEELEVELETPTASTRTPTEIDPLDRQLYFAEKLGLSSAQVALLNKSYGRQAALSAMEQLHGFPPAEEVKNVYGYLRTVASFKAVAS